MCKYILSAMALILLSNQAFAAEKCGYNKAQGRNEHAYAICTSCRTLQEFALYGAGALHGRFDDRIEVRGLQGSIVSVETETPIVTYSFTLFGFSQSISYPDLSRRHVNAVDVTGIAPGQLQNHVITTHATSLKCKQNEAEASRTINEFDLGSIDVGEIHLGGEAFLWSWSPPSGGYVTAANYFNILWDNCSNCTTESIY